MNRDFISLNPKKDFSEDTFSDEINEKKDSNRTIEEELDP